MTAKSPLQRLVRAIWGNRQTNELWQGILKNSLACTIALVIAVIPRVVAVYGLNTYLIPMTTIFAHPGQRMGKMIESLVMIVSGSLLGLGWSLFGLYMSDLVIDSHPQAASSIRAVFLLSCVIFHGFVRSRSPRLFVFVWFFLIGSVTILLGRALTVTLSAFTGIEYPILTGAAAVLVVNVSIFPEHSTSYLGSSTISTMHEAVDTLTRATHWFVTPGGDSPEAKQSEDASSSKKADKSKKKSWWKDFLSDFPNPFQTRNSKTKLQDIPVNMTTLATLAAKKSSLRTLAMACKSAQNEVNFELAISPLEPQSLKPISKHGMSSLVQNTITLIGACENKFVLLKNSTTLDEENEKAEEEEEVLVPLHRSVPLARPPQGLQAPPAPNFMKNLPEEDENAEDYKKRVEEVKPLREIGMGSAELLESLLKPMRGPTQAFEVALKDATTLLLTCLAYCYDVPKLPSGISRPRGIELQEIDIRIDSFTDALHRFDAQTTEELKNATSDEAGNEDLDLMPRMEMFLVSSFLLGFRRAATQILAMLRHARVLVEQRQKRSDRSKVWLPHHADIWQWLSTSGEEDASVLPESARKEMRTAKAKTSTPDTDSSDSSASEEPLVEKKGRKNKGKDEEAAVPEEMMQEEKRVDNSRTRASQGRSSEKRDGLLLQVRGAAADALEWAQHSDDLIYALKLAIAVFIVSWPSFVPSWRSWYAEVRGIWAPLQLVLVFEVSIGCSLFIFVIRLVGVIFGCTVGLLSYEIGRGNRAAMVAVLLFGIVPSVYIQLGTKYVKAGMIAGTTMCVVALAAMNQSGTAVENFYKRLVAFRVGSCVAILVEILVLPVRARDRLVESLCCAVRQVQEMQSALSVGVDSCQKPNFRSHKLHHRFSHACGKAQGALAAAETFLPFCLNEPRLKGSFKPLEPIYKEIIYVLHQIIDRMDNVVDLRKAYGSSILEDLHDQVFTYRRSVAASNTLMLFSVHEALTTWLPLPQFLPSSRLAQARLVNRVREIVASKAPSPPAPDSPGNRGAEESKHELMSIITEKKFLSWNASTSGYMEVIEYLEELAELTKLLVGVNAFRSGLLERPQYKDYVQQARKAEAELPRITSRGSARSPSRHAAEQPPLGGAARFRRAAAVVSSVHMFRQAPETRRAMHEDGGTMPETAVLDEDEADAGIPMSLRRVGTRLQREHTVTRRRRFTASSRVSGMSGVSG